MKIRLPAPRPCGSCPYRCDVPSGVWSREEYEKLTHYDGPTGDQPTALFMCHRQDGRLCAGWVAVHDMEHNLAVRIAAATGRIARELVQKLIDYTTDVEFWPSGAAAAEHGLREVDRPGAGAARVISQLERSLR